MAQIGVHKVVFIRIGGQIEKDAVEAPDDRIGATTRFPDEAARCALALAISSARSPDGHEESSPNAERADAKGAVIAVARCFRIARSAERHRERNQTFNYPHLVSSVTAATCSGKDGLGGDNADATSPAIQVSRCPSRLLSGGRRKRL